MSTQLTVSHNMEVAHRLSKLPGKCQNIHGHSMQVSLTISGLELNENGIAGGIDFGTLKKAFRSYIDDNYDHKLLLNRADEFAGPHFQIGKRDESGRFTEDLDQVHLPGLHVMPNDPTVENLAKWIALDMARLIEELIEHSEGESLKMVSVDIAETNTNGATWSERIK